MSIIVNGFSTEPLSAGVSDLNCTVSGGGALVEVEINKGPITLFYWLNLTDSRRFSGLEPGEVIAALYMAVHNTAGKTCAKQPESVPFDWNHVINQPQPQLYPDFVNPAV